jgi:hypothetical protein
MASSSAYADQLGLSAAQFDRIERGMNRIKAIKDKMYVGLAGEIAPEIEGAVSRLENIDLSQVGKNMGVVLGGFIGAFQEGKLTELIADSVSTGFTVGFAIMPGLIQQFEVAISKLGNVIGDAIKNSIMSAVSQTNEFLKEVARQPREAFGQWASDKLTGADKGTMVARKYQHRPELPPVPDFAKTA